MTETTAITSHSLLGSAKFAAEDCDLEGQMMLESVHAKLFGEEPEPTVVGARRIIKRLGSGGMGEVYLALNTELDRFEALKVVRSSRARDPRDRLRLAAEAKSLARLAHPNVVHVYGGELDASNNFYLAMEFTPGQTLEAWQRSQPHPWREVLAVYLAAGQGLHAVHQAGLVHRDFKPSNVILGDESGGAARRVRVIDFGLAIPEGAAHELSSSLAKSYGTPFYLSPEQCLSQPVTAKSDQFSFCVALYDAIYHQHPYFVDPAPTTPSRAPTERGEPLPATGPKVLEELVKAIHSPDQPLRPPPADTGVPTPVFRILARGLQRDPTLRHSGMDELLRLLERELRPSTLPRFIGVGLATAAITGSAVYGYVTDVPGSCDDIDLVMNPVWNSERNKQILQAFTATKQPFAATAHAHVQRVVDAYVKEWQTLHHAACDDTYELGRLDAASYFRQKQCLDRGRTTLDATLQAFMVADADTVKHAHTTIDALPPLRDCAQLAANACVTADLLQAFPAIRDLLSEVHALEAKGHYGDAAGKAAEAMAQAEAAGNQSLLAEAAYVRGRLLAEIADWPGARAALTQAIRGAEASDCQILAIDAMNELGRVDGLDPLNAQVNLDFWPVVSGALGGLQESGLRLARAYKNLGLANQRKRTIAETPQRRKLLWQEAEEHFSRALGLLDPVQPEPLGERSTLYGNLGLVQLALGKPELALQNLATARELALKAYGPEHPATFRAEFNYGHGLVKLEDGSAAVKHLHAAETLTKAASDRDNGYLGRIHAELSLAYELLYDFPRALQHAQEAERIFLELGLPPQNKHRYAARRRLGNAFEMLGDYDEALKLRLQLAADARSVADDPGEEVAISFFELGVTYLSREQWAEAQQNLELALAMLIPDENHDFRQEIEGLLALALLGQGKPEALAGLKAAENEAKKLAEKDKATLIDLDSWVHFSWGLAQATCTELPEGLSPALAKLPDTPRLARLRTAMNNYRPDHCTPLGSKSPKNP